MWTPPQRIKHSLLEPKWPTQQEAAASLWFSPIRIGPLELEERTWVPAMVPWRATEEGHVTPEVLEWYQRFAVGRPGALVVEATGVRDIPSGPLLRAGHDRFIEGLSRLVDIVRQASDGHTRLFIQLIDFLVVRRRPSAEKYFARYFRVRPEHRERLGLVAATDEEVRSRLLAASAGEQERVLSDRELEALRYGYRQRVTDVDIPEVRDLPTTMPDVFASAAARAKEAGFDGVELHFAHAYTMASFLSARNDRTDGFGGARENRAKVPLRVYQAVRERVGGQYVVGCRYLAEDCIAGGNTVEDATYFGLEFARAGMDYLSLSRGGRFEDAKQPKVGWAAYPYTGPSGYECIPTARSDEQGPFGRNVGPTATIHRALRAAGFETPTVVSGGIHEFSQGEQILLRGDADIVGAARQSLADPDWFRKMRDGRGHEIRRCTYTNYCEALDQQHKQVTCKLWDRTAIDEVGTRLSEDGRRRLTAPGWKTR